MSGGIAGPSAGPDVVVLPRDSVAGDATVPELPGVPLAESFVKSMALPHVDPAVLREVVRRQVRRGLKGHRWWRTTTSYRSRDVDDRTLLLITAVIRQRGRVALPRPLWLFGAVSRVGLVTHKENSLLAYRDDQQLVTVAIEDGEVVFIHGFSADADLAEELELSAHAVYLRLHRRPLSIDRVIVFEGADQLREPAAHVLGAKVTSIAGTELIAHIAGSAALPERMIGDEARWLPVPARSPPVPAATESAIDVHRAPRVTPSWSMAESDRPTRRVGAALALTVALVLAAALPIVGLRAMTRQSAARIADFQTELRVLQPRLRAALALRSRNAELARLAATTGAAIVAGRDWHRVMVALDASRPTGLRLTSLTGASTERWNLAGRATDVGLVGEFVDRLSATGVVADVDLTLEEATASSTRFEIGFLAIAERRVDR